MPTCLGGAHGRVLKAGILSGPRDILLIPGTLSHVELLWERSSNQHLLKRLTAFARVIIFDKRGQGLSDRVAEHTLEERIGDVRAVMDAAGSERATIYGWSEGGPLCLMFAATNPARTSALVLYGSFAYLKAGAFFATPEAHQRFISEVEKHWGEGVMWRLNMPSQANDRAALEWGGRVERATASPGSIVALMKANYEIDIRQLLPTVQAPTLSATRSFRSPPAATWPSMSPAPDTSSFQASTTLSSRMKGKMSLPMRPRNSSPVSDIASSNRTESSPR